MLAFWPHASVAAAGIGWRHLHDERVAELTTLLSLIFFGICHLGWLQTGLQAIQPAAWCLGHADPLALPVCWTDATAVLLPGAALLLAASFAHAACVAQPHCLLEAPACPAAGWDEIIRLKDALERKPAFSSSRYHILPLHSMVPAADQRRVFLRPPLGVRKIILATNIAETAITIDDVTVVINSGGCSVACTVTLHKPGAGCKAQQALMVARDSHSCRVQS